jgi:HlyD family type I secretion membrane fusion protein
MAPRDPVTPRAPRTGSLPRALFQGRRRALSPADLVGAGAVPILPAEGAAEAVQGAGPRAPAPAGTPAADVEAGGPAVLAPVPQTVPRPDGGSALEIIRPVEPPMRMPPPLPQIEAPMAEWRAGGALTSGVLALVFLVGGLGVWSTQAQLSSAVVTSGIISGENNRQVVQHPDGGVVGAILVKDGDTVKAGDVLIRLDGTRLQSELTIIEGQLREIAARQARLDAERDGKGTITFPPDLIQLADTDPEVRSQVDGEETLFATRLEALAQQTSLLDEQNAQIGNRIDGLDAQKASLQTQIDLMDSELADQERLLRQKLTQAARVLDLQRERARMTGQLGQIDAEAAELRGKLAENGIFRLQLTTKRQEEATTALRDLQFREIELVERQLALAETLSRLDVRAPLDGVIYNSQVFAVQSVVQAAQPILYIVPQDQSLVISARIEAMKIDEVSLGQEASLRFSAFDQRKTPPILGNVAKISADTLRDEATGASFYAIEVVPRPEDIAKLGADHTLLPGMPVEVFLTTGQHTVLSYLLRPFMSFFDRAFRE